MPKAAAKKAEVWMYAVSNLHPMDDNTYPVEMTKPDGIAIDCQYANGRRLTVVIPGITRLCEAEYVPGGEHLDPKAIGAACLTRPDADGTMGPIRTYIVEPVTLKTRIDGLGLGMSRAEILDIAKARGHQMIDGEGESLRLRLGSDEATIVFGKITGASRAISIRNSPGDFRRFTETKYRFGLDPEWVHHYPPGKKSFTSKRWKSRTDSAVLESFPTDDPQRNVLHFHDSTAE